MLGDGKSCKACNDERNRRIYPEKLALANRKYREDPQFRAYAKARAARNRYTVNGQISHAKANIKYRLAFKQDRLAQNEAILAMSDEELLQHYAKS